MTQKVVSKAEGWILDLNEVTPSIFSGKIGSKHQKDPRYVEAVLREAKRIVRMKEGRIITELPSGHICANSGIDRSNMKEEVISLLPPDPDSSAKILRDSLESLTGKKVAVIISDTTGRPFRIGQINIAIGAAGIAPMRDYRGKKDMWGRELSATVIAVVDEIASAAELVMNKSDGVPVALVRGYDYTPDDEGAKQLIRPAEKDLFA